MQTGRPQTVVCMKDRSQARLPEAQSPRQLKVQGSRTTAGIYELRVVADCGTRFISIDTNQDEAQLQAELRRGGVRIMVVKTP